MLDGKEQCVRCHKWYLQINMLWSRLTGWRCARCWNKDETSHKEAQHER
jgi:hypothetical protein